MKIAVIGATGFVGTAIVNELIKRGHSVTGIARNISKLPVIDNLYAAAADINNEEELVAVLKGHDTVISSYNAGWTNPNLYNDFLEGSKHIQSAVKKAGVAHYFVVGGAGSLHTADGGQFVDSPQFPAEWKPGALAARDYLNVIREEKELNWTFLSPALEMHHGTSGVRKGTYRTGTDTPVFDENNRSVISVEDMAIAIADEVEQKKHIQQRYTVAY
ncbi:MAG: NAD(P)H-binding protein [Chitinophagaceae bacterium]|nr:NAD(P)H-binding protein [Chitinophagaceae bacterium]